MVSFLRLDRNNEKIGGELVKKITLQICALVALAGVLGMIWNASSDNGIALGRNHFRGGIENPPPPDPTDPVPTPPSGDGPPPENGGGEAPPEHGLQVATLDDVLVYVEIAGEDESIVILDARRRDNYDDGHLPGALHLFHFQADRLIEGLRERLDNASTIVIYCGGGDCEDSINLASSLISDYGYDYDRFYVYEGGMEEWEAAGNPVEKP